AFERGGTVALITPSQLIRRLRMKSPEEEQQGIERFAVVETLVIDDMGMGSDSAYARQVLQEILDARDFQDRHGLGITSRYSPATLATRMSDPAIASRLAGMCETVEVGGPDHRFAIRMSSTRFGQSTKHCA